MKEDTPQLSDGVYEKILIESVDEEFDENESWQANKKFAKNK